MKTIVLFAVAGLIWIQSLVKPAPDHYRLSAATKSGWVNLFDGKSLKGWHTFNTPGEAKNWTVTNGELVCLGAVKDATGGDLVTDNEYGNFELSWSWKIEPGGITGIMYHVIESPKYHGSYETGPEYQLTDDIGRTDKLEETQKTGSDYAMHTPDSQKKLNPVGQWNTSKIIFNNGHVEHWLNGKKILEFEAWSDDWYSKKAASKWKAYPDYGMSKTGHISLQDHGHKVFYKDIVIKEL